MRRGFSREQAKARIGRRVMNKATLGSEPVGCWGRVVQAECLRLVVHVETPLREEWYLKIEWESTPRSALRYEHLPPRSWFDQSAYERFVLEL